LSAAETVAGPERIRTLARELTTVAPSSIQAREILSHEHRHERLLVAADHDVARELRGHLVVEVVELVLGCVWGGWGGVSWGGVVGGRVA
jgi:hypothetical protein